MKADPGSAAAREPVLERFKRRGALLEGHFQLSSGLHSPVYFQSALLLQHPAEAEALARELAERLRAALGRGFDPAEPPVVVAPALGGVVIAYELARQLGTRSVFAEREQGRMALRRGFRLEPGEAAIVCEDVITTGGSAREVTDLIRAQGGSVLAVAALVHRGEGEVAPGVPFLALERLLAPAHARESCPQCAAGVPLRKPGSRGTNAALAR